MNVRGTENIIRALEKHSPNAMFFYSSSVLVYGDKINTPEIRVTDALNPSERDEYA